MTSKSVCVVVAHPDDEVLGFGASIASHVERGDKVHILILATGLASRGPVLDEQIMQLEEEAKAAASVLGAHSVEFGRFPDNAMDTVSLLSVVQAVETFFACWEPDVIYTHHHGDINIDHEIVQRAVLTARRPLPGQKEIAIFAGEVLSSSEYGASRNQLRPDVYRGVAQKHIEKKMSALMCYKGELREWPHPRSPEAIQYLARNRGAECGREFAEVLEVLRIVSD